MNNEINAYLNLLNESAEELSKYEGFTTPKFVKSEENTKEVTIDIIIDNEVTSEVGKAFKVKINKKDYYNVHWFAEIAKIQVIIYQTIIKVLDDLSHENGLYAKEQDKFEIVNNKEFKSKVVQNQLLFAELNIFKIMGVYSKISETSSKSLEDMNREIAENIKQIFDAISRLENFERTPKFHLMDNNNEYEIDVKINLDNREFFNIHENLTIVDKSVVYDALVKLTYAKQIITATLDLFRELVLIETPVLYKTKLFKKIWTLTSAGDELMICLDLSELLFTLAKNAKIR